jgi:O-antigen ligase
MITKKKIHFDANFDWKYVIQNSFVLSILAYLIFVGGRGDQILISFLIARFNLVLFTVLFILWLYFCKISGKEIIETDLILYAQLFLGVTFISVLLSDYFWQSFNEFYLWGLYFIIFIGIQNLIYWGWKREQIFNSFLLVGGLVNFTKIILRGIWFSNWLNITDQGLLAAFQYRGNSPNQSAAFANLVLMLSLARFVNKKNERKKPSLILLILCSVITVILTSSRGGILGMAAGIAIVIVNRVILEKDLITKIWKNKKRIILSGVGFILVLLFLGVISSGNRPGVDARYDLWMVAFQSFKDNPVFGSGLYTMGNQLLQIGSVPPSIIFVHAHNVFLNILGELGIVGFCVFILLLISFVKNAYKSINCNNGYIAAGALGAVGSFLAHGLVDTLYVVPHISISLIVIISLASAPVKKSEHKRKSLLRSSSVWAAGFVLCVGWVLLLQRIPLDNAIRHYDQNKEIAIGDFEKLEKLKPNWALLFQQRAITESFLAIEDKENQLEHIHIAIDYFEKSIEYDPLWATNYANLGVLYKAIGEYQRAFVMMQKASALAPDSALIALNSAIIAEKTNEYDLAKYYYCTYILMGDIEDSGPFWQETTLRTKIYYDNQKSAFCDKYSKEDVESDSSEMIRQISSIKLAEHYYNHGEYQLALNKIRQMELMGLKSGVTYLELLWIKSKLEIQGGDYKKGLEYAKSALNGWRHQSIYGPGTYGGSKYSEQLHRSPSIKDDLIPQFEIAPIPQNWINRMVIVGKLYREINATEEAINILLEVISIDSNNEEASVLLEELGANGNHDE